MKNYHDRFGIEVQPFYPTRKKLVKSGCLVEVYKFGNDILLGPKPRRKKNEDEENDKPKELVNHEEALKSSARRAKRMIKRLIYSNSFSWFNDKHKPYKPITITLTFKENVQDLKVANYEFTKFIRRLNYEANKITKQDLKKSNLKYLAVFELQQRGAIHYHVIFFNLPYINNIYDKLKDIWGQGIINVGGSKKGLEKIKNQTKLKKIIDYFIKYIQKSIFENSFPSQKKYITSKGLIKPKEQRFEEVVELIEKKIPPQLLVFSHDGESEYNNGSIFDNLDKPKNYLRWFNYWQYDLSSNPELANEIDDIIETYS